MLDPIGGHERLCEFFLSYLDTAFRIRDPRLAEKRRELLRRPGTMAASPFIEPVLRYTQCGYLLEDLLHRSDGPLKDFDHRTRAAFIDLALSGLFPGKPSNASPLLRASLYQPYMHQTQMLERGIRNGSPSIVTSGTGSGKTEAFMLPVLASIVREAINWPKAPSGYLSDRWWRNNAEFRLRRHDEPIKRPRAVRALILYPMNALVEDQMTRLRRTLDSPEAHKALDHHLAGNRIFFGRYTSAAPVTGHLNHPRQANNPVEIEARQRRTEELRRYLRDIENDQQAAREYDDQNNSDGDELTRYLFPSVAGSELLSRWDMQASPPDILVTNASMLSTMLAREVERPIFEHTRNWLTSHPDAQFFLVLDELHLLRGSPGTEVSGLLRALIHRLGLDSPQTRHKLRILASSASLPLDDEAGDESLRYLDDFFGPFGTFRDAADTGFTTRSQWAGCIIPGIPALDLPPKRRQLDTAPFCRLVDLLSPSGGLIRDYDPRATNFEHVLSDCHQALMSAASDKPLPQKIKEAVEAAAAFLTAGCADETNPPKVRAASLESIAERLFGERTVSAGKAVRGLTIIRGMGDRLSDKLGLKIEESTPSFRLHQFIRSIEGLFATPRVEDKTLLFDGVTIERGLTYTADPQGYRRKFELIYCEACGEVFIGGMRGTPPDGSAGEELLPSSPDVAKLPESGGLGHYEDLSYTEFALFWPTERKPQDAGKNEHWDPAILDTNAGVVLPPRNRSAVDSANAIHGRMFVCRQPTRSHNRTIDSPGTAAPDCCPACGISYAPRKSPRYSPIRSFRTGFNKTSQLMATELFELLHASGSKTKAVVFSDSRQDAANAALNIERAHYQDLRRQLVIEIAKRTSAAADNSKERERLEQEITVAQQQKNWPELARLSQQIQAIQEAAGSPRIPLKLIVEQQAASAGHNVGPMLQRMLELGIHPTDDAGVAEVAKDLPWQELFRRNESTDRYEWCSGGPRANEFAAARNTVVEEQAPHVDEVLFSKTYFALEETGLGYPSLHMADSKDADRYDSYLRVLADSYRVSSNRWYLENPAIREWTSSANVNGRQRLRHYAAQVDPNDTDGEIDRALRYLAKLGHINGIIDATELVIRVTAPSDPYWRCPNCGRVHLHRGPGICTRCYHKLPVADDGKVTDLWDRNFLAQRIVRDGQVGIRSFRLRCEELTGQTGSPAGQLRKFKGIILGCPAHIDQALYQEASEVDLLSVTTTMEVGIDIGALQTVYQANMPPQRFNYQQRVGRAGRRGQAFSVVLTLCRSRSHDLHYFNVPESITGDPPPPPFLATEHIDIPLRLLRKVWLSSAFDLIRNQMGAAYPGDDQHDTHGEFIPARVFFDALDTWAPILREALKQTEDDRDSFADALGAGKPGRAAHLVSRASVDQLLEQLATMRTAGEMSEDGLAQFIAEQGLMPMYGMPTRVRALYLGLKKKGQADANWDSIDRDLDLAITEFAPSHVLVRDKRKHKPIGFTGPLPPPKGGPVYPSLTWFKTSHFLARCDVCQGTTVLDVLPHDAIHCADCKSDLEPDQFRKFYVPSAFRTSFWPIEADEDAPISAISRSVVAEIRDVQTSHVPATNLSLYAGPEAAVLRLNEGPIDAGTGEPAGYTVKHVHQRRVSVPRHTRFGPFRLENQFVIPESTANPANWEDGDQGVTDNIFLISRKPTEALYLGMDRVPDGIAANAFDRTPFGSSVRAAAVSATYLIVQRAALELDIDPDEFEVLEPRKRNGRPLLQISDRLVNGAGFSRRLRDTDNTGTPLVLKLINSMLNGPQDPKDPLVASFFEEDHRRTCAGSCYRCLQRYGNRQYHGLLDWRLGLGYLRCLVDVNYRSGLDGRWADAPEISDWPILAAQVRDELCRLNPGQRKPVALGDLGLPGLRVQTNHHVNYFVMVHPLWSTTPTALQSSPLSSIARDCGGAPAFYVDTFHAARRPASALHFARERPTDR